MSVSLHGWAKIEGFCVLGVRILYVLHKQGRRCRVVGPNGLVLGSQWPFVIYSVDRSRFLLSLGIPLMMSSVAVSSLPSN